ncbi:hypothetical protein D3C71_621140 [compost metagenome]
MESAIMIVWLRPAMIVGVASGNSTPKRICLGLPPKAVAASTTSRSTCRMPRSVRRINGGTA